MERELVFRTTISEFIASRRDAKLQGKEAGAEEAVRYDYATWLADAARRVGQIQAVTHVLKATHPDARGSSLHVVPDTLPRHEEIGSHLLGDGYTGDVVGNAAALDVFKFLRIEIDGRRLLDWMQAGDEDLRRALHSDAAVASGWMDAFGALVRNEPTPSSHGLAKQIYWLVEGAPSDDAGYHLLQPMFPSSLVHAVHADIQDARFGEANTLARQAFRANEPSPTEYRDYRGLVARKLGGTKPQNISQLNSERRGVNYLLASLPPPAWNQDRFRSLLRADTAMDRFGHFSGVRALVGELAEFLLTEPEANARTRERRQTIEQAIAQQLPVFAASIRANSPSGWTRDPDCRLPPCQQLWLDPERIELPVRDDHAQDDEAFIAAYHWGDWPDDVAGQFANWLIGRLKDAGLHALGDVEYTHWARQAIVEAAWPVPLQRRAPAGEPA